MAENKSKKSNIPQMQETRCIYLPGEPVKNIATGCDYKIILGTVREVVFNFKVKSFGGITVEVEKNSSTTNPKFYGVFDLKTKKLISGKIQLKSGVPYRVHISRFFKGTFVVKANGRIIGRYTPSIMDATRYGTQPAVWVEPLYIGFSEAEKTTPLSGILNQHGQESYNWLSSLPAFNTPVLQPTFQPKNIQTALTASAANLNNPNQHAVVAVYKAQAAGQVSWRDVIGDGNMTVGQLEHRLGREDFNELVRIAASFGDPSDAAVLSTISFSKDNLHWRKVLNRRIQVKWTRGYLAIAFKGYNAPFGFTHAGLAHDKLKGLTGGVHIRKSERIWLSFKNAHTAKGIAQGATKGLAGLGLAIDLVGDYHAVMVDEKGSREVMELLGRAGISVAAAGVGVVAASAILMTVVGGMTMVGTLPVWAVLLIGAIVVSGVGYKISEWSGKVKNAIY